ncbi:major facilitator superfamily MFS_1 [Beutenbergia cavernae DSM 12333]|uniref:Major facilitator superfamily MFS_1 n=1 Tax=Beutenbergia cavernae (strain ATCC BAA-8 / DSM 12333 / CCUG 43141 / JCM 11478 / NBRC 16432 / NCIMB 13614 / HKI 0122) TaxID=471853 RepID=C5BVT6_BEUC1|nr:MFS transporter [Beutenbergia cavernae]ACQ78526.1 major facilitator superfamily MFS_1 [Beutenbergia cavernae DSM 12333]
MPRLLADTTPLRVSPAYRRLWWGLGISNIGWQLTVVAVGLQVYDLTASTFAVGLLGICALVPLVLLGLYGGALVDAFDRRKVALASAIALWFVTAVLAAQAWLDVGSVPLLYAIVAVQSAGYAINNPARTAIIPRLVGRELLPAANALQGLSGSLALTLGPLLGAFLVATWGYAEAYTLDLALFTGALYALWRLPDLPPIETADDDGDESAARSAVRRRVGFGSVLEGLRYLGTRPNVRMTFVLDLAAMVLAMPRVLFPAVGVLIIGGGAGTTGTLTAAIAVGAVLASLFSGGLGRVRWQGRAIVVAIACFAVSVAGFGVVLVLAGAREPDTVVVPALVAAFVLLALAGASDAVSAVFRQTVLQAATPDHMRGRLQGVFIVVVAGGPRLGDLVLGAEATWLGEGWAAVVGGLSCLVVVALLVAANRRFLSYDARDPQP